MNLYKLIYRVLTKLNDLGVSQPKLHKPFKNRVFGKGLVSRMCLVLCSQFIFIKSVCYDLVVKHCQLRAVCLNHLQVGLQVRQFHRILFEVHIGQLGQSLQVGQLVDALNVVTFQIKDC